MTRRKLNLFDAEASLLPAAGKRQPAHECAVCRRPTTNFYRSYGGVVCRACHEDIVRRETRQTVYAGVDGLKVGRGPE